MSESVESSSSGDSSTSADTPQGPLSVLLQMVLKSAQAEAEQSSATPPEAFTSCPNKGITLPSSTPCKLLFLGFSNSE